MRICLHPFLCLLVLGCSEPMPASEDMAPAAVDPPRPMGACDPRSQRPQVPELFVGPTDLEPRLLGFIDKAQRSIDLLMYEASREIFVDRLIEAHKRGVKVRVILDGKRGPEYDAPQRRLSDAGVPVKAAPMRFSYAHSKVIIVDGSQAVIMSANMDHFSMDRSRNYGVIDRDPEDLRDLQTVFEADWALGPDPILPCTRLLVSPVNSMDRLQALVASAQKSLDFEVMYLTESKLVEAVKAKVKAGVQVRILLATDRFIMGNGKAALDFQAAGAQVKHFYNLHAKLVVADGVAFIGSVNMSFTSLTKNREIGVFVSEKAPAEAAAAQFDADWKMGVAPTGN